MACRALAIFNGQAESLVCSQHCYQRLTLHGCYAKWTLQLHSIVLLFCTGASMMVIDLPKTSPDCGSSGKNDCSSDAAICYWLSGESGLLANPSSNLAAEAIEPHNGSIDRQCWWSAVTPHLLKVASKCMLFNNL